MFYSTNIKTKRTSEQFTKTEILDKFSNRFGLACLFGVAINDYPKFVDNAGAIDFTEGVKDVSSVINRTRELPRRSYFTSKVWNISGQEPEFGIMAHFGLKGYHTFNFTGRQTQELGYWLSSLNKYDETDILILSRDIARHVERLGGKYKQPRDQWWGHFMFTLPVDISMVASEYQLPISDNWISVALGGSVSPLDVRRFKQSLNILVDSASDI